MQIKMRDLGKSGVLAGALGGRAVLGQLLEILAVEPEAPEAVFLDFGEIEVATSSYMRESVIALRDVIRGRNSLYYPVVANPNGAVRDELLELARSSGEVLMMCAIDGDGTVSGIALTGDLEAKQILTLKLVQKHGETDAGLLMREYGEQEKIRHTTAWNNRLSALATLGLIVELRQGRLKRYRPLLKGA